MYGFFSISNETLLQDGSQWVLLDAGLLLLTLLASTKNTTVAFFLDFLVIPFYTLLDIL